jgi:hypothetical protein
MSRAWLFNVNPDCSWRNVKVSPAPQCSATPSLGGGCLFQLCSHHYPSVHSPSCGRVEMKGQPASLQARQPATTPPPPYGVESGASSIPNTCLGSAATITTTPSLDPTASRMLDQYLACVAACSRGRGFQDARRVGTL